MPIVLGKDCHKASAFIADHRPNAHAPDQQPLPQGHYVVWQNFFPVKTNEGLQKIIDNTYKMKKN
jgi:hypothetical protein